MDTLEVLLLIAIIFAFISFPISVYLFFYVREKLNLIDTSLENVQRNLNSLKNELANFRAETYTKIVEISDLKKRVDELEGSISDLENRISGLKNEINSFKNYTVRMEVPYEFLVEFLEEDDTDEIPYNSTFFVCMDYSNKLIRRFLEQGYFACEVPLWISCDGTIEGHVGVAVKTDKGIFYIEPQTDTIVNFSEIRTGVDYCDLVNFDCDCYIERFNSCFGGDRWSEYY